MKRFLPVLIILIFTLLLTGPASGQKQLGDLNAKDPRLFPLEDLRPGMKGVARTVFSGSETQEFGVEILGVLPGFPNPRQSAIIGKLTGSNVEKTGVFAGMSGSPVYIDGKLVGAIAFSFPFSKEPIAGITPIKQMIDVFGKGAIETQRNKVPRAVSFSELASTDWKPSLPKPSVAGSQLIAPVSAGSPLMPLLGQQMVPIATPLVFSGISQESLAMFAPQLSANGLLPVSGVGGGAGITPLASFNENTLLPGSSVSVQLIRGDYSIAASGTVTMRDGERIYAFGHQFLLLGSSDIPMTETSVVTVISSVNNSFKLAVPGQMVGSISQDRSSGVFGQLGQAPKMIPVKIKLHTSRERTETFSYEVANDPFLTPLLLNITVFNTITSSERALGDSTISVTGEIRVKGQEAVQLDRRFSASANSAVLAAGSVASPLSSLLASGFDDVQIDGINLDISSTDTKYAATLERIAVDRTEVRRGEKIEIQAYVRTESGKQFVQRIPVQIPDDATPGQLLVFVGDGGALQEGSAAKAFVPQDLGQLVKAINTVKKGDRLYVKLFRITAGAVIGTSELPNLPPSVIATLNSDRTSGGYTPTVLSPVYEMELPPADFVISGQQLIGIDVVR